MITIIAIVIMIILLKPAVLHAHRKIISSRLVSVSEFTLVIHITQKDAYLHNTTTAPEFNNRPFADLSLWNVVCDADRTSKRTCYCESDNTFGKAYTDLEYARCIIGDDSRRLLQGKNKKKKNKAEGEQKRVSKDVLLQ